MSDMNLDFLNERIVPVAFVPTTAIERATTLQTETYLLTCVMCAMVNSGLGGAAEMLPQYNHFLDLMYHSLPITDDSRNLLLSFFEFEKVFKKVMDSKDPRWIAAEMQVHRIKDGIVLLETSDAESDDEMPDDYQEVA